MIIDTLSPIINSIMEVENGCTWKVTILLETHPFLTEHDWTMIMGESVNNARDPPFFFFHPLGKKQHVGKNI